MSHECPECGQTCYCNGDIEDMENQDWDNYVYCNHYLKPECDYNQPEDGAPYIPEEDFRHQFSH